MIKHRAEIVHLQTNKIIKRYLGALLNSYIPWPSLMKSGSTLNTLASLSGLHLLLCNYIMAQTGQNIPTLCVSLEDITKDTIHTGTRSD